jgi:cytochrome c oxidase cbb3-type subunit 3
MAKRDNDANSARDRIIDHEYDGIQEYDNPMPRWWLLTFAGTIIFSILYYINIGPVGNGKGRIADYEASVAAHEARAPKESAPLTDSAIAAFAVDASLRASGKETYAQFCASCHAPDGGGLIGPNLTDDHWIHGGTPANIYQVVDQGVLAKGMPPWGKTLKPEQLRGVVAFVTSLHGTTPAKPKAPQGELVAK